MLKILELGTQSKIFKNIDLDVHCPVWYPHLASGQLEGG